MLRGRPGTASFSVFFPGPVLFRPVSSYDSRFFRLFLLDLTASEYWIASSIELLLCREEDQKPGFFDLRAFCGSASDKLAHAPICHTWHGILVTSRDIPA
jgi:hypothetical protein